MVEENRLLPQLERKQKKKQISSFTFHIVFGSNSPEHSLTLSLTQTDTHTLPSGFSVSQVKELKARLADVEDQPRSTPGLAKLESKIQELEDQLLSDERYIQTHTYTLSFVY